MAQNDICPYCPRPADIPAALGLLSRLPIRVDLQAAQSRAAAAVWAYPLAGLVLAVIAGIVGMIAIWLGLSASIVAALTLGTLIVSTGAMHEDGLADSIDGLWGGWDKERRLKIMKDSHIGTYGVLALILSVLIRWSCLSALIAGGHLWAGVLITAMASRALMVAVMVALPHARGSGLSHSVGHPAWQSAVLAAAIAAVLTLILSPTSLIALALGLCAIGWIWARVARAKIGGQTGDILGATQQLGDMTALIILTVTLI